MDKPNLADAVRNGIDAAFITSAKKFGSRIAGDVTSTQIRNVYGTVKILEMQPSLDLPRLLLLKPRIEYANARATKREKFGELVSQLIHAIDAVAEEPDAEKRQQRFKNFSYGFEAILAYHKVSQEDSKNEEDRNKKGGRPK